MAPAWASWVESAAGTPEGRSRPASSVQCPGAARRSLPLPGCSPHPPSPPDEPADTIPPGTSLPPSMASKMTLWMAAGGTLFNRQVVSDYPPARPTLPPPFTRKEQTNQRPVAGPSPLATGEKLTPDTPERTRTRPCTAVPDIAARAHPHFPAIDGIRTDPDFRGNPRPRKPAGAPRRPQCVGQAARGPGLASTALPA